ncbi:MAG: class I adenylate-forming enzyme family protein [Candidatus Eiseniibacteriota bacterium]
MKQAHTHDPIQFWSRIAPDRLALRHGDRIFTYGNLEGAVQESADAFLAQGLGAGEHVSLEFDPTHSLNFAIALHALHRVGLLPVPIGATLTADERQERRRKAMVDLVLTGESIEPSMPSAATTTAAQVVGLGDSPPLLRDLDVPAALCFTSGTTGEPRAALLTHGNFFWSAIGSARNLGVRAEDLWLSCMPLHHVGGLSILTRSAAYGTGVLIHETFDANAVNEAIDREGVTLISLVPPMLERLLKARGGRLFPTTLRAGLIGGGPIPPALLEEAADLRFRALPTYGLTEAASQVTTLSIREWPAGLSSAGRPLQFTRVELRDESNRAVEPGVEGEILVQGPTVMAAYFEDRATNAAAWDGRWLRTGDVGAWDAAGRLVVLDRRADRFVVGGENVSPDEVERILRSHPSVADVGVVGLPSGAWGHEVTAVVTLHPGATLTLDALTEHARSALSSFKLPRRLVLAPSLPRGASGKLLRRALLDRIRNQVALEEAT